MINYLDIEINDFRSAPGSSQPVVVREETEQQ